MSFALQAAGDIPVSKMSMSDQTRLVFLANKESSAGEHESPRMRTQEIRPQRERESITDNRKQRKAESSSIMPRAADAKVWNEDLVKALKAREEMARRQGKPSAHTWLQGWKAIQAVRGDIYAFKNGRIVNLPSPKLGKTVDNLCRAIIAGQAPLRPDGYIEHVVGQAVEGNPYLNDPYCNRIKKRGGAYAILLAFYVSPHNQVLTKDQICELAQPFCDEEMEGNWHAGRAYGAFAGNQDAHLARSAPRPAHRGLQRTRRRHSGRKEPLLVDAQRAPISRGAPAKESRDSARN